jgi:uridine phosphorylase
LEQNYPILEFDPDRGAILMPTGTKLSKPCPPRAVVCFFLDVLSGWVKEGRLEQIGFLRSEAGDHPLYQLQAGEECVLVFHPSVGAPLATGLLEESIAMGVKAVVACGGVGVLSPEIALGHPVILTSAVRDEGTSYHYLPPSREVAAGERATAALQSVLTEKGLDYRLGKAWTTDAYYRETPARRALRVAEGCSVVDMEAAAFFAVAQFRGIEMGQLVYGGDLVVPEGWDFRDWTTHRSARELLFQLAVESVLKISI